MKVSPCRLCGADAGEHDPDPCWGWLPGVNHSCCGHGDLIEARYISTMNGRRFGGPAALAIYEKWAASAEGRAVIALWEKERDGDQSYQKIFGWVIARGRHASCGMTYAEHACRGRGGRRLTGRWVMIPAPEEGE